MNNIKIRPERRFKYSNYLNKKFFDLKNFTKEIRKEYELFIVFAFLSCVLPIIYCLLASLIKPNGSQAVMGMGHVMPFLLAFVQISFSISMIVLTKVKHKKEFSQQKIIVSSIWLSIFLGLIFIITYILSSFTYMYFSNNRPNTQDMLRYGLDFIWWTIPFIFLFPLFTTSMFIIKKDNTLVALWSVFFLFSIATLLSFIFGIILKLKIIGLAIGLSIAVLILIISNFIYIKRHLQISFSISFKEIVSIDSWIVKNIFRESMAWVSLSIFKGVAIICLSFTIPNVINDFVPLPYQMSRVIWFNMMYFIPCIGIGVSEQIRYHYQAYHAQDSNDICQLSHTKSKDRKVIIITFIVTIIIAIGTIFMIQPLNYLYTINDLNNFNGSMPVIEGWGTPTLPPTKIINFNELKNLNLTPLPEFGNNNIINLIKFTTWVNEQIKNNPTFKDDLNSLIKWIEWINQKNNENISIIDFLQNKYQINFWQEISNMFQDPNNISNNFALALKNSLNYIVHLWLYSSTSDIVSDSFLLLRPMINYHNLLDGNENLAMILINNPIKDVLISLFLKVNSFNAKAMIYVSIYGIFNAIWSILIQINQRNNKKGIPLWLLILVYAFCVGFLVSFGTLFAVTLTNVLQNNNPFMYLDAWTFPLIVISFLVIIYLIIKTLKSYKNII